ncbi:MAG TPA: hypothetical protein ACHBX0_10175 [Arsenophonus sp.]
MHGEERSPNLKKGASYLGYWCDHGYIGYLDEGYWRITRQHATTLKLKWRLSRRYLPLKSLLKYKS